MLCYFPYTVIFIVHLVISPSVQEGDLTKLHTAYYVSVSEYCGRRIGGLKPMYSCYGVDEA